jgi:hypothetical protein
MVSRSEEKLSAHGVARDDQQSQERQRQEQSPTLELGL